MGWKNRQKNLGDFERFALEILKRDDKFVEWHFRRYDARYGGPVTQATIALEGCEAWAQDFARQADLAEVVRFRMRVVYERLIGRDLMEAVLGELKTARYGDEKIHEG